MVEDNILERDIGIYWRDSLSKKCFKKYEYLKKEIDDDI